MGIQRTQEDSWSKEMAKWEQRPVYVNGAYIEPIPVSAGGRGGITLTEYPKMLYRAESADGGPRIAAHKIVQDSDQEAVAIGQGWSLSQEKAIEQVHATHREMARLAANRVHNERWMSEKARAEAALADESMIEHLPAVPVTPIKRRVRRTKAEMAAAAAAAK
jgi:hypothetical protein